MVFSDIEGLNASYYSFDTLDYENETTLRKKNWDWLFEQKNYIRTFLSKENETDTKIVFETNSFLMENEFVIMAGAPVVTTV